MHSRTNRLGKGAKKGSILRARSAKLLKRMWTGSVLAAMRFGVVAGTSSSVRTRLRAAALEATGKRHPAQRAPSVVTLAMRLGAHKDPKILQDKQTVLQWLQVMRVIDSPPRLGLNRAWRLLAERTQSCEK